MSRLDSWFRRFQGIPEGGFVGAEEQIPSRDTVAFRATPPEADGMTEKELCGCETCTCLGRVKSERDTAQGLERVVAGTDPARQAAADRLYAAKREFNAALIQCADQRLLVNFHAGGRGRVHRRPEISEIVIERIARHEHRPVERSVTETARIIEEY